MHVKSHKVVSFGENIGIHTLDCEYVGAHTQATFYVVDVNGPTILRLPSSEELQLVTLNCVIEHYIQIKNKDHLREMYPDNFRVFQTSKGISHCDTFRCTSSDSPT